MNIIRARRRLGTAAAILAGFALVATAAAVPATAAPPVKPGKVTGLAATVSPSGTGYDVSSTWNAASNATGYQVKLVDSLGATLASSTVSATAWTARTTKPAMSTVQVQVTPVAGTRKGTMVSLNVVLPDVTPPTGTFSVSWDVSTATVTQQTLTDDVSPAGSITRQIDWDQDGGYEPWPTGDTTTHTYPLSDGYYQPMVKLTDQAGNSFELLLHAVVIGDDTAPTGAFTSTPTAAWAGFTTVQLSQTELADDFSQPSNVLRMVNWGDGSPITPWPTLVDVPSHVYAEAGTYTPTVTLEDEAGNTAAVSADSVTVTGKEGEWKLTLTVPKTRVRYVSSWKTLKGKATDGAGTGVSRVEVRVIEKRGTKWYAFRPATGTWVRTATATRAWSRAGIRKVAPTSTGTWSARVVGLRKGTLYVKVVGVDRSANRSATVTRKQLLTR